MPRPLHTALGGVLAVGCALASVLARQPGVAHGDSVTFEIPREGTVSAAARSLVVTDPDGVNIMAAPTHESTLAGHTLARATFPILETRQNRSCRRLWIRIGPDAWVCGERGQLSALAPRGAERPPVSLQDLPWSYAFTSHDSTRAYHSLTAALAGSLDDHDYETWEAHWGVAIENGTFSTGTDRIVRTRSGFFLRRSDVYRSVPSAFSGASFAELAGRDAGVPFGWVSEGDTFAYPTPSETGQGEQVRRLTRVHVFATRRMPNGQTFARVGEDRWLRADHVRWIAPAPAPREIDLATRERWIDVDLTTQTLTAYEGAEAVYATMISSGGGRFATERGVFRIWGRYLAHTMDNTESAHLPNHFRLGDVPYVQFFDGDRGLHGVYWHDQFGVARSHGCINLSLADAAWLFDFTAQALPVGWASRAIAAGSGTIVRVRGRYPE